MSIYTTKTIKQLLNIGQKDKTCQDAFDIINIITLNTHNNLTSTEKHHLFKFITDLANECYNSKDMNERHKLLSQFIQLAKIIYLMSILFDLGHFNTKKNNSVIDNTTIISSNSNSNSNSNNGDTIDDLVSLRRSHLCLCLYFHMFYIIFLNFNTYFKVSDTIRTRSELGDLSNENIEKYVKDYIINDCNTICTIDVSNAVLDICQINNGLCKDIEEFIEELESYNKNDNVKVLLQRLNNIMCSRISCGNELINSFL